MWALGPFCTFGEEKSAWTRVRVWPPDISARILVTILTELSGLTRKCYYSRELTPTGAWRCVRKCVAPEMSKDNARAVFKVKQSGKCAATPPDLAMSPSIWAFCNVTSVCSRYVATRQDSWENRLQQQFVRYFPVYNGTAQLCKLSRLFVVGRLMNLTYPVS